MTIKKSSIKGKLKIFFIALVAFALGMIIQFTFFSLPSEQEHAMQSTMEKETETTLWTCSMHPQIKLPKPGKCPICFMDLIPLEDTTNDGSQSAQISISEYSKKLIELETTEVVKRFIDAKIRLVGKVDYDETKVAYISAWVSGRLDRLYVNYTGIAVSKGDHMAKIYSPDLLSAQEELIQALKTAEKLQNSDSEIIKNTAQTTINAAREKLELLGLNNQQIQDIEQRKQTNEHITINSPISGVVIHQNVKEGMYVQTGTNIYTVADLSSVWVKLDAYESDLQWVRYGGKVEFTTEVYPGKIFTGIISFVDPIINPDTRTANVRVIVPNESLRLKPGMFVRAVVHSKIADGGQIMNKELAGKWISPMHPEIIKDEPGICDVCGMPLVSAESLGYVDSEEQKAPLIIPVSAALLTGKRAVVYVEVPDQEKPTYEGREIVLGPKAGNYYIVEHGLYEGERVVTKGVFKLDAELQIQAKPSMMSGTGQLLKMEHKDSAQMFSEKTNDSEPFDIDQVFRSQLTNVITSYFSLQQALAGDNPQQAKTYATMMRDNLEQIDMTLLQGYTHMIWMGHRDKLNSFLNGLLSAESIEEQRKYFAVLSNQLTLTIVRFPPLQGKIYKVFCPMAFDNKGASWLQNTPQITNPYFGAIMLRCGNIDEEITFPASAETEPNE